MQIVGDNKSELKMETVTIPISGRSCAACSVRIEKKLNSILGVTKASVNLATNNACIWPIRFPLYSFRQFWFFPL